jgi:microcin C transport system substrate-binding protein
VQPDFERLVLAYKKELEKLGFKIDIRVVDSALYVRRIDNFDFDIIIARFGQSFSPGNEQREFWGSAAADKPGSRNVIGIKSPAIDTLIERLIYSRDRADLVTATRALDRVLLWNTYVVPQFHSPVDRVAYWNKFNRPLTVPRHTNTYASFLRTWWYDDTSARRLEAERGK